MLAWISSNSPNAEVLDVSTTPSYKEKEVAQAVQKSTSIFIFKYKCTRVHVYSCRTLISPFLHAARYQHLTDFLVHYSILRVHLPLRLKIPSLPLTVCQPSTHLSTFIDPYFVPIDPLILNDARLRLLVLFQRRLVVAIVLLVAVNEALRAP